MCIYIYTHILHIHTYMYIFIYISHYSLIYPFLSFSLNHTSSHSPPMATPLENMAALLQKSEWLLAPQEQMNPPMRVLLACMVES